MLFHTAQGQGNSPIETERASEQVFADGIRALAAAGANIIVDDAGFLNWR